MVRVALSLTFVVALASVALASPVSNLAHGTPIALSKRGVSHSRGISDLVGEVELLRRKTAQAFENYKRNTGETHRFDTGVASAWGKREEGTEPLTYQQDDDWTAEVLVGTPGVKLLMSFDTGSADVVIYPGKYLAAQSSTAVNTTEGFQDQDGLPNDSYINGTIVYDTVSFAELSATNVTLKAAVATNIDFVGEGDIGLAFPSIAASNADPLVVQLVKQGKLTKAVVGLGLYTEGGSITFGGVDKSQFKGKVAYSTVNATEGLWATEAHFNDQASTITTFSTETNLIFGPSDQVKALWRSVGVDSFDHSRGVIFPRFKKAPSNIKLSVGGVAYTLSAESLTFSDDKNTPGFKLGSIVGQDTETQWTVGTAFFKSVYAVLDYEDTRIGFAPKA